MNRLNFSFPSPTSYFSRALWLSSQELAIDDLVCSLGHIRFYPGIVQQALGSSAETAVSPHHNYQSTNKLWNCNVSEVGYTSVSTYKGQKKPICWVPWLSWPHTWGVSVGSVQTCFVLLAGLPTVRILSFLYGIKWTLIPEGEKSGNSTTCGM
jgi:hypothetical protein